MLLTLFFFYIGIFKDYLNEMYGNASKKKKILQNMNKQIGYKIRDLRKLTYEKLKIFNIMYSFQLNIFECN